MRRRWGRDPGRRYRAHAGSGSTSPVDSGVSRPRRGAGSCAQARREASLRSRRSSSTAGARRVDRGLDAVLGGTSFVRPDEVLSEISAASGTLRWVARSSVEMGADRRSARGGGRRCPASCSLAVSSADPTRRVPDGEPGRLKVDGRTTRPRRKFQGRWAGPPRAGEPSISEKVGRRSSRPGICCPRERCWSRSYASARVPSPRGSAASSACLAAGSCSCRRHGAVPSRGASATPGRTSAWPACSRPCPGAKAISNRRPVPRASSARRAARLASGARVERTAGQATARR